jgi:hypothetical protein
MAPGWWNKVKKFGSSVWNGIKKVGETVAKIVKPIYEKTKPLLRMGGNMIKPGMGDQGIDYADQGFDMVDDFNDGNYKEIYQKSGLDNIMSKKIKLR